MTDSPELRSHLETFVRELIATQDPDGYMGPFLRPKRLLGSGLWDVWGHYHCLLGLLLWHAETGDVDALAAMPDASATCSAAPSWTAINGCSMPAPRR